MRKAFILIFTFLAFAYTSNSENDSWQILLNKKVIFKGSTDKEETTVSFKTVKVKPTDSITINYNPKKADNRWKRFIYINDSADVNIKTLTIDEQRGSTSVNASLIKNQIDNKQPVFIYTTAIPKDKSLAARIRVRRVLLCKIEWN